MRDTNLQFKDFDEVLDEIADRWETLDNVSKKAIANAFAGVRQQESFVTLMENYDKYQELLEASKNSAGTAESKYGAYRDSLQAATSGLTAAWEKLVNDAEINNILKDLTKLLTKIVNAIPQLLKHLPSIIAAIENIKALSGNSMLQKAGGYLGKNLGNALLGERGIFGKTKLGIKYRISQINEDYERRMLEAKRNGELTAEREADFIKARDEEIAQVKKSIAVKKQDTEAIKEGSAAKQEEVAATKESTATEQQEAVANEQSTMTEQQEAAANQQSTATEQQEAAANRQSATSTGMGNTGGGGKFTKFQAAAAGISIVANQALAGLTALSTQGTTHTNDYGETVESSQEAQKAGSGWAALATFAIPLFGSKIGEWISQKITSDIDRLRDQANHLSNVATDNLSGLKGLTAGIEAMRDVGSNESMNAADDFLANIYSSENEATRKVLEKYLGDKGSIYDVVNQIKEGNEEAYKQLKVAQLEAEKAQIIDSRASQLYSLQNKTGKAYNAYDNYAAELNGWTIAGGAGLGLAGGAGVGAIGGSVAVALGASGPVGWIIGAIGALVGLGFGIAAGIKQAEAERQAEEEKRAREVAFNAKSNSEKIAEVEETRRKAELQGNSEVVDKCNNLISLLQEQKALVNEINNEINKITEQQALLTAKLGDQYLTDMSVVALQTAGRDAIIEAYAKELEKYGGLLGYEIFDNSGKLTDNGYDYVMAQLKRLDDDEINSVLSGGVYTLSEILKLRGEYGDERWIMEVMDNFATALNIPLDELEAFEQRYGSLKLSELLMSTDELQNLLGNYTNLLSAITTGAGDTSKWMETIIGQFPELIAYMGNTSELFSHLTTKINQLSDAYLQAQYQDIIGSTEFYKTIKGDFESKLSQENIDELTKVGVDSVSAILSWIQKQYDSNGNLNSAGAAVLDALEETVNEYGVQVTSNILKSYYEQIIDFRVKTLDKELDNLNAQKEALQDINSQREYENKLIEAKLRLEDASKEKKRVYRAGVGWVYESDQSAIAEAQKELEALENQKTIAELDRQIADLTYEKEKLSNMFEEKNYETLSELYQSYLEQSDLVNASSQQIYESIKEGTDGISKALEELIQQDTENNAINKQKSLEKAKEAWENLQETKYGTSAYNTALQNYHSAYDSAVKNGATESDFSDWGDYHNLSAWDTGSGSVNDQLADARLLFRLNDTGTPSQYFEGSASLGEPLYDATTLNYIFSDLKNNNGWIWTKDGKGRGGFKPTDDYRYTIKSDDQSLVDYVKRIQQEDGVPDELVFTGYDGTNESVYFKNGVPYKLVGTKNGVGMDIIQGSIGTPAWAKEKMAHGALDFIGGNALINELGTEAIVTPYGTVTSLPSHTGVVPADLTKNLWELGEVAPMIQKQLLGSVSNDMSSKTVWGNDESFNIGVMNMTLSADSSFNIDAFVDAMKTHVALNKNNRR